MDDLQSNVDDFLDVMIFLKQSLGEARWHQMMGAGGARGWVEWEVEFPYVMTFLSSLYKMPYLE